MLAAKVDKWDYTRLIETTSKDIFLLLDQSGSMHGQNWTLVRRFVNFLLNNLTDATSNELIYQHIDAPNSSQGSNSFFRMD